MKSGEREKKDIKEKMKEKDYWKRRRNSLD
jgi:hypothetical protein